MDLEARTIERSTPADDRVEVLDEQIEWFPEGAASPLPIDVAGFFRSALD